MNTVVNQLLQVDREARHMTEEARRIYDRTLEEMEEEKARLRNEFQQKGDDHIRQLEAELGDEVEESAAALRVSTASAMALMEGQYGANHARWEEELCSRCLAAFAGDPPQEKRD